MGYIYIKQRRIKKDLLYKKYLYNEFTSNKQYESLPILMTGKDREKPLTHTTKDWHNNQSFFMQITPLIKAILHSVA
jgi:hypothetical protein